jgi:hypothetical protein
MEFCSNSRFPDQVHSMIGAVSSRKLLAILFCEASYASGDRK